MATRTSRTLITPTMQSCLQKTRNCGMESWVALKPQPIQWGFMLTGRRRKSKTLAQDPPPPEPVSMGDQRVEAATKFTYLGSDVDSDGYSTPEVHKRIGMASSIMGQLDTVWNQQRLCLQTKLRLYSSLVLSVLLYGSETWTLRKADSTKVQAFHMLSQRRILGIKWYDHITNKAVREKTGLLDLPMLISDRRHFLFGHVFRQKHLHTAH